MYSLQAEASFDAAHFLANHPGQCRILHGHRWKVRAEVQAAQLNTNGPERGMLLDFAGQCGPLAVMDKEPKLEGRHMSIFLSAKSAKTNKQ